jgi:hypothetical protein
VAAVDLHRSDAADLLQARLEHVFDLPPADVGRLDRADREGHDREGRDVESDDGRILDLLWQPIAYGGDFLAHLGRSSLRVDLEPQLDAHVRERLGGARLHALDPVDAGDRVLDGPRHERFDFLGRGARVNDADVDEGKVDLRKEVDAEPRHRHDAQHHEAHDDHGREDGPADGDV